MTRARLLLALLACALAAAAPGSAVAASHLPVAPACDAPESPAWDPSPGYVLLDTPEAPELGEAPAMPTGPDPIAAAHLKADCAERTALQEQVVRRALQLRPGAQLELRYEPSRRTWVAWVHERGGGRDLARVEVDDRTGLVTRRESLDPSQYPTRLVSRTAIDTASADREVRRVAREFGGVRTMTAVARFHDGCCWEVDLFEKGHEEDPAMRVDIRDETASVTGVWTGIQVDWEMARGNREAFGGDVNKPWVWLASFVLFAMIAVDWRRLRSAYTLDVVALLALGISHEAFQRGEIDWSVPLALPPLLWLFARMCLLFARGVRPASTPREPRTRAGRLATRTVPTWMVVLFCVLVAGLRIGIDVEGTNVIDVGYAGVAGARLELDGRSPWGNMPQDNPRGDTYGPLAYLLYVPAVLALDDDGAKDDWDTSLPAAHAMSIVGDLWAAAALLVLGWRWISRRAGVLLAAAWLTCPWTLWALGSNGNDQLMAALMLTSFALLPRPVLRGGFMAAAAAVKFAPLAALLPLLHCGPARRRRQALLTALGAALVIGACWLWVAHHPGGTPRFLDRTVRFQADRESPFSIWGLYGWHGARRVAEVLLALLLIAAAMLPGVRDYRQVAAGIAAATIGVQLVLMHWFYLYVPWFLGFVLVVLIAARFDAAERPLPTTRGRRGGFWHRDRT